jgi:hypothetical protein
MDDRGSPYARDVANPTGRAPKWAPAGPGGTPAGLTPATGPVIVECSGATDAPETGERRSDLPYELSAEARETTLRAARAMFPHDRLPDEAYAKVVTKLEADARGDETIAAALDEGAAQLQGFAGLDPAAQLEALRRHEDSAFFKLLQSTAVVELYDNPLVWKAFGYEGPSTHAGGYLHRGFDDLDWLPDPPLTVEEVAAAADQLRS